MAKSVSAFFCSNCGAQSPKWVGKCPKCHEWNTYQEEIITRGNKSAISPVKLKKAEPILLENIRRHDEQRMDSGNGELNRVLGGGFVPGSIILIGGEPGIGKSTLMLQVAMQMKNKKILYVSGEESEQQILMRAERLGSTESQCYIYTDTSTSSILGYINEIDPDLVVIDSIQTLVTDQLDAIAGSIAQIRESAYEMQQYAKSDNIPILLIGHITKDGTIAGPKLLEHMVDTVLQFEGDRNYGYRILRANKNRFGSTSEIGIFEMDSTGLREVSNPSELLISQHSEPVSGSAIAAVVEGLRPILIEVQALVGTAAYGTPQRATTGFDARRLNMLIAVIEKRTGLKLSAKDIFVNIAGGLRIDDPAADLAVVAAILSSLNNQPIDPKACFAAEIGLSGELRPVARLEQRLTEAAKMGFTSFVLSSLRPQKSTRKDGLKRVYASKIEDIYRILFDLAGANE